MAHFAVCQSLLHAFRQVLPHVQTGWTHHPSLESFMAIGFQESHFRIQALLVDFVHTAFTDAKHRTCFNASLLIQGRMRQATRRWPGLQSVLHSELD